MTKIRHIHTRLSFFPYSLSLLLSLEHRKCFTCKMQRESHPYVMFDIEEYSEYRARCNAWCSYYSLSCFNENQIKFMFLLLGHLLRLYLHFPFLFSSLSHPSQSYISFYFCSFFSRLSQLSFFLIEHLLREIVVRFIFLLPICCNLKCLVL